ncbi:Fanconi anemia group D2 protein homolog isoform X4 [Camellia sinensis]|uniref:Fanconi anemia group D2 protein homolog isoform X4 n=1 Tax=Camellia sinensis TaxID=4442 RepID=UPI001036D3F9|nr:Fanconi anemia group D2 protein homolog isoform X4 [Camellia sinensis]
MVLLHHQTLSRKRPPSNTFVSPFPQPPPKIPKSTTTPSSSANHQTETLSQVDKMVSVLADAGCTLINPSGPPSLPSDPHKLRRHLHRLFSSDASLRSSFLSGFSSYILSPLNLRMVLVSSDSVRNESLVRVLLLVPSIQLDLLIMLLEKLPEYFDVGNGLGLDDDVSRLILNQFRWLDFLVDSDAFAEKLLQVLSICPLHLKKEIIGSLPEIIGDQNNRAVVDSLEQMLQEDSAVIVPVLDSFSNLNLDDQLQEQVITIALSCIRTIDAEHMPYLLRFLLLSATPANARRIISHIRQQLKFVGASNTRVVQNSKLKGKSPVDTAEVSILDALRSCLQFKNTLCQEILKELKCLETARDHKVIDVWLLMLIYMNGESLQKSVENIFKKKIIEGCIQDVLFDQCIRGNKELVQDYIPSFLSLSECLLACKEQKPREFGIHIYRSLFEEFVDTSSRQEVLGTLVTHMGSGVSFEVSSALEAMVLLASKYSEELIPLSSHISGILDYLEGFSVENLHKVYEVFSLLALSAWSSKESVGSSIANELLMIVRKQVSNPDLKYKKMGLIGTLKIVSCHGDANNAACSSSQKSNYEEALELLKLSMESCKQLPLPLILFYDELISVLDCRTLHPAIMEWIGKHASEFESLFLSDLEGGQLPIKDSNCGLEGELWMNLDGDISPVCLNILPLVLASMQSGSLLQILPAKFLLLSTIERLANQGSLGGIDALLGCPLHLPSFQIFSEQAWQTSTDKQKKIVCISLYYAANWIRELLNAFCTQVSGRFDCVTQATKEEIIVKLLKRLRNLVIKIHVAQILRQRMTANEFLRKILPLFSSLQKHLNCAVHILKEGTEFCQEHWSVQSALAKNPDLTNMVVSKSSVCNSLLKEILTCFRKMLNLPDIQAEKSVLSDLLEAFQPTKIPDSIFSGMQVIPSPGNIDYLYCGAYSFLEGVLEEAITLSFTLASEVLLTLDSVITSVQQFLEKSVEGKSKDIHSGLFREILPTLQNRLGTSAYKLLRHNWDNHNLENGWKSKGVVQKILQIYLVNSDSTSDLLCELVCSILPQATLSKTTAEDDFHGFPTLCSATFDVWYRVMHEENLRVLNKLVKEVILLGKPRAGFQLEAVEVLLKNLQKTVNVVVSLINMCRTHDKISVHAMAVKYGGKFVDSFLKVFDFLQTQFQIHNELIIQLVKELQKATRTLQTVCSEAKGMKQTAVTSKIPATKRSLERFLFHVKALLYTTSSGCTFWMGNLKHKDLMGQVVSSQAYVDEQNENAVEDFEETVVEEDQQNSVASEEERETE